MANKVGEVIDDIAVRVGDPAHKVYRRPVILRAMKRVYKRYNEKYPGLVSRETSFVFSDTDITNNINYKTIPADWIKPYKMNPVWHWRDKSVFRNDEDYTYTIDIDEIYFAGVKASTITVRYYSYGWELKDVDDASLASTGEVNTPEWPEHLWELLLKATCLELSASYPQVQVDISDIRSLKSSVSRYVYNKQATDPDLVGPQRLSAGLTSDPYQQ